MPYPTAPTNPYGRALKTSVLQINFLCYKQNTFERALSVGNPQQPCCVQDTSRDQATHYLYFRLNLGLAQWKAWLSSTAALWALPGKRIYAEREGTGVPSTVGPIVSGCHIQLNVYFVVSQLHRKQKVREGPLQNRDGAIHLFTSSQDSSGRLLLSSFFPLPPEDRHQVVNQHSSNSSSLVSYPRRNVRSLRVFCQDSGRGILPGFIHQDWLMEKD